MNAFYNVSLRMLKIDSFSHSVCAVPSHKTSPKFHLVSPRHPQRTSHPQLKSSMSPVFLLIDCTRSEMMIKQLLQAVTSLKTDPNFKAQFSKRKRVTLTLGKRGYNWPPLPLMVMSLPQTSGNFSGFFTKKKANYTNSLFLPIASWLRFFFFFFF